MSSKRREGFTTILKQITGIVPFRSGRVIFVPQRASVTINTRLGDCKDLSSLFTSLARMAGLRANMGVSGYKRQWQQRDDAAQRGF
jgi:hypothetical protein